MTSEGDPCTTTGCSGHFERAQTWMARKHKRGPDVLVCDRCGLQMQLPRDERAEAVPRDQGRLF